MYAKFTTLAALLSLSWAPISANEYADELTSLSETTIQEVVENPALIAAIEAQNAETAGFDQAMIDNLDKQWRAEVDASSRPLIDRILGNDASAILLEAQEASGGVFTEIFAMDARGLNVGQSGVTSDYWQGDESKWQVPFEAGNVELGEVEEDESTQTFQSQVSVPVKDEEGNTIGAITFGVNVELL